MMISKIVAVSSIRSNITKNNRKTNRYNAKRTLRTKEEDELMSKIGVEDLAKVPDHISELGRENINQFSDEFYANVSSGNTPSPTDLDGRLANFKTLLIQKSYPELITEFEDIVNNMTEKQRAGLNEYYAKSGPIMNQLVENYGRDNVSKLTARIEEIEERVISPENPTLTVAVSGAAGQIAYSLLFRIASGGMFGSKTPVEIRLLDIPGQENRLEGVKMELEDCAFPLVRNITTAVDPNEGFLNADWVLLVGGSPRTKGMERKDLLLKNAEVFKSQGQALNNVAKGGDTRVLVVGNPANTNAWIASENCPSIPKENFAAMTRLDHNRGVSMLSEKLNVNIRDINKFVIWGNHSATQFPDISHALANDKLVSVDKKWLTDTFIPAVQQRGAAVIAARGASSAASAASSICDNVRDWYQGTKGSWTSVAVPSKGEYGVTPGLFYSYPVVYENLKYAVVEQLPIDNFAAERMEATHQELLQELEVVRSLKN